ncbi:MAG: hypothetical protein AB7V39_22290 [Nitrospiraceae bacterium]
MLSLLFDWVPVGNQTYPSNRSLNGFVFRRYAYDDLLVFNESSELMVHAISRRRWDDELVFLIEHTSDNWPCLLRLAFELETLFVLDRLAEI